MSCDHVDNRWKAVTRKQVKSAYMLLTWTAWAAMNSMISVLYSRE